MLEPWYETPEHLKQYQMGHICSNYSCPDYPQDYFPEVGDYVELHSHNAWVRGLVISTKAPDNTIEVQTVYADYDYYRGQVVRKNIGTVLPINKVEMDKDSNR